ncbi:hypothetical protein D7W79_40400 [Corallococcus exercitus]|uniref:HNH endonuclease n=1 Tax=Corallococcus exercitus TaxID=2316736 RepID=UPI000EA04554|nr:HNH endonuclease [Corallococcus exercitus]RKG63322.1 hypothetical protein D7W79_40400 [Corallococcus exercitus]
MSELHSTTVYTIIDPQRLLAADRGTRPSKPLSEGRRWKAGQQALAEAHEAGKVLAIVFADARDTSRLLFTAILHSIELRDESTRFTFTRLQPLHGRTKTELRLASTGDLLSAGFIRPYAMVQTPRFLRRPSRLAPNQSQREGMEEGPQAFLVHVNPGSVDYEDGFDAKAPLDCAAHLLRSQRDHGWTAGNCWRMMRKDDLLLFKFNGGRLKEPAAVYFAGRVSRTPFIQEGFRKLRYVVDVPLTEQLMTHPLPVQRLQEFVPKSWGAAIQALKGDWKRLFEPQVGPLPLARNTPQRLRLVDRAVTTARRLARDQLFARSLRLLAQHRCAVCPPQIDYRDANILEAAHIRPVAARGPDHPRNGLVLCPTHHALFDEGLWSLSDDGKVVISKSLVPALAKQLAKRIPLGWEVDPTCVRWHRRRMRE